MVSSLDRVNVCQLTNLIERTLTEALDPLREPDGKLTKESAIALATKFVSTLPVQEYKVVCDDTNNPPSTREHGALVVDIYVKPVATADIMIVTFTVVNDETGERHKYSIAYNKAMQVIEWEGIS